MDKVAVLREITSLQLEPGTYVAYGATPLAILGIREVNDVDLLVTPTLYEDLLNQGWERVYKGVNDEPVVKGCVEAHKTWTFSPYAPTLQDLLSRAIVVDGMSFASIEDVRQWKLSSMRPKDPHDLDLIDHYLRGRTGN